MPWAKFEANDILCRIYDKTLEILHSDKKWFENLWSVYGWEKGDAVTRVGFQCRRKIIKKMQIKTIDDLFVIVPDLWRYLTVEWLTIRLIQDDTHRNRWPYLTQQILVIFCAEVQQLIYEMLNNRASLSGDEGLNSFVVASEKRVLRGVQKDSIATLAECFGKDAKDKLNESVGDKDITIYNNTVRDRHDVAHSSGVTISFQEVKDAVDAAIKYLEAFEVAIQPGS
ncbi:HEPN domain-containing protein [Chloroflexota bacterium]